PIGAQHRLWPSGATVDGLLERRRRAVGLAEPNRVSAKYARASAATRPLNLGTSWEQLRPNTREEQGAGPTAHVWRTRRTCAFTRRQPTRHERAFGHVAAAGRTSPRLSSFMPRGSPTHVA